MNSAGLYEIYDFWHEPFWQTAWFRYAVLGVGVCLLMALAFFVWRLIFCRRKKRLMWDVALEELAVLKTLNLEEAEIRRGAYHAMTRILKNYLTLRYGWDLAGLTDNEAVIFLYEKQVDHRIAQSFERVVLGCVMIKFAQESSVRDQVVADVALSEEIIRATIPSQVA